MKTLLPFCLMLVLTLFLFNGCKKDPVDPALEINFVATWGDQPLVVNHAVPYPKGYSLRFQEFDFLLNHIKLQRADGSILELAGVEFIDFKFQNLNESSAKSGVTLKYEGLMEGDFSAILLGIGLDSLTNATKPKDYPAGNILSISGNRYWDGWSSYIFSKLQGFADFDVAGQFTNTFAYHSGGNGNYRPLKFDKGIKLKNDKVVRLQFELDVRRLLGSDDSSWWDMKAIPSAHSPGDPAMPFIMDNYANALSLQ